MVAKEERNSPFTYVPPSKTDIENFAQRLCDRLAKEQDESFGDPEIVRGLVEFLLIVGTIQAKYLNRLQAVDNDSK